MHSRRVLIVNLGGIGDIIMSMPAIEAIVRSRSEQPVDLLISGHAKHLLDHSPWFNHVHYLYPTHKRFSWLFHQWGDMRVLRFLRKQDYSLLINLHTVHSLLGQLRMLYYMNTISPDSSVGISQGRWGGFYTHVVDLDEGESARYHKSQRAMRVAEAIGAEPPRAKSVEQDDVCLVFAVDNVDRAYETLKGKGGSLINKPHDRKYWGIRCFHLRDPDGNLIEINKDIGMGE